MLKRRLAGIRRYASIRAWRVKAVRDKGDSADIARVAGKVEPVGVVSMSYGCDSLRLFGKKPIVCLDCPPSLLTPQVPYICQDAEFTAHLVVNELMAARCASFAFAHYFKPPHVCLPYWGKAREMFFRKEVVGRCGADVSSFAPSANFDRRRRDRELAGWLRSLPTRCGIFAANDSVAADIRRLAAKSGISIPDDIAVVGVDDERRICLKVHPTITSVALDWERSGYAAAAALGRLVDGLPPADMKIVVRPLGLVRRETTTRSHSELGPRVDAAVALIRARACKGLNVPDVVAEMRSSRRYADRHFREVTGFSILEEIRRVRFDCARELLVSTNLPLAEVAERSGWQSLPTFCREFKRVTGMPPEAWRLASR